jgi:hypothetical protein
MIIEKIFNYDILNHIYSFIYDDMLKRHFSILNKNNIFKLKINKIFYNNYIKYSNYKDYEKIIIKYFLFNIVDIYNNNIFLLNIGLPYNNIIYKNYYNAIDNIYNFENNNDIYEPIDVTIYSKIEFNKKLKNLVHNNIYNSINNYDYHNNILYELKYKCNNFIPEKDFKIILNFNLNKILYDIIQFNKLIYFVKKYYSLTELFKYEKIILYDNYYLLINNKNFM